MMEFINSPLVVAYASEYHTGILDELAHFEPEWVQVLTLGNKPPAGTPDGDLFRRRVRRDRSDATLMSKSYANEGRYKRRWIIEVFITDVVVASKINAAFNPTTLFAPMVERQGSTQTMETYSHMLPGVGDVAATALEEPLADLLLPYCCQDPSSMIVGSSLFIGFAGKIESRRADSNR